MRLMPICWYANLVGNLNSGPTGGGAMDRKLAGILAADVYSTDAIVLPSTHAIVRGMGEIRERGRMPRRRVVSDESVIPSKYAGPARRAGKPRSTTRFVPHRQTGFSLGSLLETRSDDEAWSVSIAFTPSGDRAARASCRTRAFSPASRLHEAV